MTSTIQNDRPGDRIPVSILTGFLGAGKTSLLNKLVHQAGFSDTAIIINEFGEIGLDHLLVENIDENIVSLNSGCLCCTVRGDLIETLGDLARRRERNEIVQFRRAFVETTGLADPAPIIHTIMTDPGLTGVYDLDGVWTVVDAVNGETTLDQHEEAIKQVAVADRLILSKLDCLDGVAGGRAENNLRRRLGELNPGALVIDVDSNIDAADLLSRGIYDPANKSPEVTAWLNEEAYGAGKSVGHADHDHGEHTPDANRHDDRVRSFCIAREKPLSLAGFSLFLEILAMRHGTDLLRMKGIVNLAEHPGTPAVVHGVQHIFHPAKWLPNWPDNDQRTRLVFITRDIERATIEAVFDALCGEVTTSKSKPDGA